MQLTKDHIDYIIKDLNYRGIVLDGFRDEVIDHVCSAVEIKMKEGQRFIDAYQDVLKSFGHTSGLRHTQRQVLQTENKTPRLMFKNYFKIAFRNLSKHRFYSFINVAGLAVGVASCLIIALYIVNEFSYDKHHKDYGRIYRINSEIKFGGTYFDMAVSPAPLAEALVNDFPEIEAAARFRQQGTYLVKREKDNFREGDITFADSSIFKVFTLPFLLGNPEKALTEPNTIVITKKIADKYFPNENPLGQSLIFFNNWNIKIVGVIDEMPATSHFHFNILISMAGNDESKNGSWLSNNFQTYFKLREGASIKSLEAKFVKLFETYVAPEATDVLGGDFNPEKFFASGNKFRFYTIPMTDIHLRAKTSVELEANSDITYVYLFGAIAAFILIIACINFMNLSTARSANRAKEVGIRKVLGSFRSHLVRQFLLESILLSTFAFILALGMSYIILPTFNELASKQLQLPLSDVSFYLTLLVAALFVGSLAGVYPSFFLSAFKPVNVLKGKLALGVKSGLIRSGLVVFQFSISIFLIVGTIAVNRQLNFIQNKKIGFNKDQVIVIKEAHAMGDQLESFKTEVLKNSKMISGTISGALPVSGTDRNNNSFWPAGSQPTENNMVGLQNFYVDYDYVNTLGMKILEGRDFSRDFPSDSSSVILNQAAVKAFNLEGDPLGKKIETFKSTPDNSVNKDSKVSFTVVGIVEDFNFESLRDNITPLALFLVNNPGAISFRFKSEDTQEIIQTIEQRWRKMAPGQPFQYSFLDEDFSKMYSSEQRLGKIFGIFAGLAILIACLGLFALTAFTAEQRTKEIGIRKVLGATVSSIVLLLSKEFGKLIIISFALAAPLSWYACDWWLESYTYKTEIGFSVYIFAGLAAFTVAWLTMGFQSIKAASVNPVNSLRSE